MSTVGRLSKLVDRKVIPMPNKATIIRVDQITVDLQISAGSGVIHHVSVQGDIGQLTPGMVVPIQWTERDGGYLAPVVIATGNAVVSGVVPSVNVDNLTIQSVDGELQVRPGGIETRHLAFVPSIDGHSHPSELATAGLQTREGILENVAQDFAIRIDGTIDVGGDLFMSGVDATYRLWVGDPDPTSAPFSVEADGTVNGAAGGSITVEEADGTPSVGSVTKIKVPNGTLADNGSGVVTFAPPLTVEETDGTPSVSIVSKIKVPNGALTDNGSGVVTLQTGLLVKESDSYPSVSNVNSITVPNTSLRDNGSGAVSILMPAFAYGVRVYRTGAYTLTNSGTMYAIPFDYERWDDRGFHSNTTNNTRLTAPADGWYYIWGDISFAASTTGARDLYLRVGGSTYIAGRRQQALTDSGRNTEFDISSLYYLTDGQYVEIIARQYSGGSLDATVSANNCPEFAMIGPLSLGPET